MPQAPRPRRPAVGVIALGCPKNLVDTEVMLGLLRQAGFRIVSDAEHADVLLVTTCCFIEAAREESGQALAEAAAWRRADPTRALVCGGCWPQMDAPGLRRRFPEIDAYLGPGDVPAVVSVIERALAGTGPIAPESAPAAYLHAEGVPRLRTTPPWTAYLKIADGCSHACRFCVIPRLRGPFRSRRLGAILREARRLADAGVREVNLIAQDTTAYGSDTGEADLADLLEELAGVEGLRWIRVLYGFPARVTDRLVEVMAGRENICDYLDVPFQHADPEVLRRMGRPGDGETYLRLIARLRAAMPDITLRSTFLVGFPGEREEHFARLLDFIGAAQLDRAGAFSYSAEAGTPAAAMDEQVASEVARERYHRLMMLQQPISLARNERWMSRDIEVLIEKPGDAEHEWVGRSFRDAPEIDGLVKLAAVEPVQPGQFRRAVVTGAEPYDLRAELLAGPTRAY